MEDFGAIIPAMLDTPEKCWVIHGKPPDWKQNGSNKGKGFQAMVEEKRSAASKSVSVVLNTST